MIVIAAAIVVVVVVVAVVVTLSMSGCIRSIADLVTPMLFCLFAFVVVAAAAAAAAAAVAAVVVTLPYVWLFTDLLWTL